MQPKKTKMYWKGRNKIRGVIESRYRQHLQDDGRDDDDVDDCDDETAHLVRVYKCQNSMFSLSSHWASRHTLVLFFVEFLP